MPNLHFPIINPATEETLGGYRAHEPVQVDTALDLAGHAFQTWRVTRFGERSLRMHQAAAVLRRRAGEFAQLMVREMGKPVVAAEAEVEKCAATCDYFADHAERLLVPEPVPSDAARSFVRYDPLGPVLAIMPWNFPFWQVFRFAAPALMAGNCGVLKHAPNVPGCAEAIESVFAEAGFQAGAFVNVRVDNEAAQHLIRHPVIRAVTLTGSDRAGKAVAAAAASVLKKSVLELGGSDPFIVLPDADVAHVAAAAAAARCINSGQSCIAAKRFIVVGEPAFQAAFESALVAAVQRLRVGDPASRQTDLGPLARLDLLENLDRQVRQTIAAGARLLCGGRRLPCRGFFYEPTVLADVTPGMAAFDEETFGPVAALLRATSVEDALRLANQTRFGLGASIWTTDAARAEALAAEIEAGSVFINGPVKSDPRLPFGGIKASGWGRELAAQGIREFTNVKTVWVR